MDRTRNGAKCSVIVMAHGGPEKMEDVEPNLRDIFGGREPAKGTVEELKNRFMLIGGRSPITDITFKQAHALEDRLISMGINAKVHVGMKHWHPFIKDTISDISKNDTDSRCVVGIVLAPHYSEFSVGGYETMLRKASMEHAPHLDVRMVSGWYTARQFLEAWQDSIRNALEGFPKEKRDNVFVIFTAHSLPLSVVKPDDPYSAQLKETADELAKMVGLKDHAFAYQSSGNHGKWLGPILTEKLDEISGAGRDILVVPIGYVSDNLETLYDIDIMCRKRAESSGVMLRRAAMLNDSPKLIEALAEVVANAIRQPETALPEKI
ncbi:MAG: ferrochelatase [Candidatus Micrarchaeaceae archaeon]